MNLMIHELIKLLIGTFKEYLKIFFEKGFFF